MEESLKIYRMARSRQKRDRRPHDKLPGRFEDLVRLIPPRAIANEAHLDNTIEMIDRLMAIARLTKGQAVYVKTLAQLAGAYEAEHHVINTGDMAGLDALRFLQDEYGMNASDLARFVSVHASIGSKILKGERQLTAD